MWTLCVSHVGFSPGVVGSNSSRWVNLSSMKRLLAVTILSAGMLSNTALSAAESGTTRPPISAGEVVSSDPPIAVGASIGMGSPSDSSMGVPADWSAESVRRDAAAASVKARLIEAERLSIACSFDRDDKSACAQAMLIHTVLGDLADAERNKAAGEALRLYYHAIGADRQLKVVESAEATLGEMITVAKRARELEIPDGDQDDLNQQLLSLQIRATQLRSSRQMIRYRLSRLTGRSAAQTMSATLGGSGDRAEAGDSFASGDRAEAGSGPDAAVTTALSRRAELQAVHGLCGSMTSSSLPAGRSMLGVLQPGLGLITNSLPRFSLLCGLRNQDQAGDLNRRRQQCQQLRQITEDTIRDEVFLAYLSDRDHARRAELYQQKHAAALQTRNRHAAAVRIDQMRFGSEQLAMIKALEIEGEMIEQQVESMVAGVVLRQAMGLLAP